MCNPRCSSVLSGCKSTWDQAVCAANVAIWEHVLYIGFLEWIKKTPPDYTVGWFGFFVVWTLHNQDGNTQCDQNWFLQNWLENNVNWLEKNMRAWSVLIFFLCRLVHSLMTTLERNSLFMLEMTTRVLGDCWITSIKKLSLISLVESAWYEYKLFHIATYLWSFLKLLFFLSSKQRSL